MRQKDAPPSARVAAANSLLDRGWGRPDQQIEANINTGVAFIQIVQAISRGEMPENVPKMILGEVEKENEPAE